MELVHTQSGHIDVDYLLDMRVVPKSSRVLALCMKMKKKEMKQSKSFLGYFWTNPSLSFHPLPKKENQISTNIAPFITIFQKVPSVHRAEERQRKKKGSFSHLFH